jgi:hypothetical protein
MKKYIFLIASLLALGCVESTIENSTKEEAIYFPLKDFAEVKAKLLEGQKLYKKSTINGKDQVDEKVLSEKEWLDELDIFIRSDIDNPSLRQSYETKRSENFMVHELKEGEKSKVKKISVKYSEGKIIEISVFVKEDNFFYHSEIRAAIFLNAHDDSYFQYIIYGTQEVPFLSKNKMYLEGTVIR